MCVCEWDWEALGGRERENECDEERCQNWEEEGEDTGYGASG